MSKTKVKRLRDRTTESAHRDISPQVFKRSAREATDWIVGYLENMDRYPVLARTKPGEIKSRLPKSPPDSPEPLPNVLKDFRNIIVPGMTHWNHPRFFAYFSVTSPYAGILAEMLCSAMNVNAMLWRTSPSATELEEVTLDWLRQMLGLPEQFFGVIHDCASVSSLCAMAAARESVSLKVRERGMVGRDDLPRLRMYASEQAHSSIEKAAIVLGIGQEGLQKIPTDDAFRMKPDSLEQAMREDIDAGIRPTCVIATIGTTSTTSIDPVKQIAELCQKYGVWLHVDAAYGGSAAVLNEIRSLFEGWEQADSIVVNPHKWLFTPIDCSALYCRRPQVLKRAFSVVPEYLTTKEEATNFMDYGVSLGRRFRALKLWMVIRSLGCEGIANIIRRHISYAQKLSGLIKATPNYELLAPVPFSTLVFRYRPGGSQAGEEDIEATNMLNERLLEEVNDTGKVFLSHTKLRGKFGIRLTIGNIKTTWRDVSLAWKIIQRKAGDLSK